MSNEPEYDEITDTYTTGHEWDGVKELDTPMPRWWLWTLYATIIWAVGYWIAMPAWPLVSDYTKGVLGYSQRDVVAAQLNEAKEARKIYAERLLSADLETIENNQDLLEFSMASGKAVFGDNCAGCHGSGASGAKGYPNLNDDDWLWGGSLDEIHETITVPTPVAGLVIDEPLQSFPERLIRTSAIAFPLGIRESGREDSRSLRSTAFFDIQPQLNQRRRWDGPLLGVRPPHVHSPESELVVGDGLQAVPAKCRESVGRDGTRRGDLGPTV